MIVVVVGAEPPPHVAGLAAEIRARVLLGSIGWVVDDEPTEIERGLWAAGARRSVPLGGWVHGGSLVARPRAHRVHATGDGPWLGERLLESVLRALAAEGAAS